MKQQSLVAEAALCLLPTNDRLPSAESITTYQKPGAAAQAVVCASARSIRMAQS